MSEASADDVRIGILGTASVAGYAMIAPARAVAGVTVAAIGSRDAGRAHAYARGHEIPRWTSYEGILADPTLDAIYVALPNNLHAEWSLRALRAGKAVLCEKPLASNADEAARLAAAARATGLPFVEAFHWRCHPVAARLQRLVANGEIGAVRHIEGRFSYPHANLLPDDFRLDYGRGGGVLMDAGCYAVNLLRMLLGEPVGLDAVHAVLAGPEIDVEIDAVLDFAGGATGRVIATNTGADFDIVTTITGERGTATVHNAFLTDSGCRIEFDIDGRRWSEDLGNTPTYQFQLERFADVVRGRAEALTTVEDAVANLAAVDMIYCGAGLHVRGLDLTAG
jgi:predicted dehydrogenase